MESLHLVPRKNPLITVCMQHLSTSTFEASQNRTYTVKIEDVNGSQVLMVQVHGPAARVTKSDGVLSRFTYKKKNSGNLRESVLYNFFL